MTTPRTDTAFSGNIPKLYERYLVPLIFLPYAVDLARRVASEPVSRVLEVAAGTGAVTRAMASVLPESVSITATDLNPAMLQEAQSMPIQRPVEWRQADASALPSGDGEFDAVVCQFGVMFFPDRPRAFAEARRVLRPGGRYLFNVWGSLANNAPARIIHEAVAGMFPGNPPQFLGRTPYAYFDHEAIARDLAAAGFTAPPSFDVVTVPARAAEVREAAIGFVQGTPLRAEIEARDPARLADATEIATRALEREFGTGALDSSIQAHVVTIGR